MGKLFHERCQGTSGCAKATAGGTEQRPPADRRSAQHWCRERTAGSFKTQKPACVFTALPFAPTLRAFAIFTGVLPRGKKVADLHRFRLFARYRRVLIPPLCEADLDDNVNGYPR